MKTLISNIMFPKSSFRQEREGERFRTLTTIFFDMTSVFSLLGFLQANTELLGIGYRANKQCFLPTFRTKFNANKQAPNIKENSIIHNMLKKFHSREYRFHGSSVFFCLFLMLRCHQKLRLHGWLCYLYI